VTNKRRVSLSEMRRIAAMRKRCTKIAHATIAKATRRGWPKPKLRITGSNVDFLGLCDARSIALSRAALDSPLTARFVTAHELGHFRRHHGKMCFVVNAIPSFAFAFISIFGISWANIAIALLLYAALLTVKNIWHACVMYRHEREADEDARMLVGASAVLFVRRNGTSERRLREATHGIFDEMRDAIEKVKRDVNRK
jgi:Zn-dependent protease with chaperone function